MTSFEVDGKRAARARANFAEAGLAKQADVLEQDAVRGLEKLQGRFDACFIDLLNSFPSEDVTRRVVELCIEHLDGGALLMADNALRQGEVVKPKTQQARNVAFYNEQVAKHPRLESVVIPIRDGLSVARVKDLSRGDLGVAGSQEALAVALAGLGVTVGWDCVGAPLRSKRCVEKPSRY